MIPIHQTPWIPIAWNKPEPILQNMLDMMQLNPITHHKKISIRKCHNRNTHLIPQTVPPGAPTDSYQVSRCPYAQPLGLKPADGGHYLQSWWWNRLKMVNRYVWLDCPPCMAVWTARLHGGTSTVSNDVDMPVGAGIPVATCWTHCSNNLPLLHLRYAQASHCLVQLVCQFLPPFLLA